MLSHLQIRLQSRFLPRFFTRKTRFVTPIRLLRIAFDAAELLRIGRHQTQLVADGLSCDEQIASTERTASQSQLGRNRSCFLRILIIQGKQAIWACQESLDSGPGLLPCVRSSLPVFQDRAGAKLGRTTTSPFPVEACLAFPLAYPAGSHRNVQAAQRRFWIPRRIFRPATTSPAQHGCS